MEGPHRRGFSQKKLFHIREVKPELWHFSDTDHPPLLPRAHWHLRQELYF